MCHVLYVMCQMSHVMFYFYFVILKVVKLVGEWFVTNGVPRLVSKLFGQMKSNLRKLG